jgi:uncharacterized spore protein YtfJ
MTDDSVSDEMGNEPDDLYFDDSMMGIPDDTLDVIENRLDRMISVADVGSVYGEPIKKGNTTIIPTAEVASFMGFGLGAGTGPAADPSKPGETLPAGGSGGGGGGYNFARPVAVIIATPDDVRIQPIIDVTKVAIAALTTFGFMIGMVSRMTRRR